jgi:CheY-like chemotaxis protein
MDSVDVLWLDDNSPKEIGRINGFNVVTAQTCEDAEAILNSGVLKPQWAVIDLIVPQGSWGKPATRLPGLSYISHLREKYGNSLGIVAYSIVMPPEIQQQALAAGAERAIAKHTTPFADVIRSLTHFRSTE